MAKKTGRASSGFQAIIFQVIGMVGTERGRGVETVVGEGTLRPGLVRMVWFLTLFLCAIGIVAVARRMSHLLSPPAQVAPETEALDMGFARHPWLTLTHIVPGLLFVVLGPLQFVRTLRTRRPALHLWMGRVAAASGVIIGVTALVMSPQMAIGGANETAATMLFGTLFLIALGRAFATVRARRVTEHREWMIRAFAIGLAVALVRPIVGVFFATRRLTHLGPHDFFGIAFWLGFTIQSLAAEVWIQYTRARPAEIPRKEIA